MLSKHLERVMQMVSSQASKDLNQVVSGSMWRDTLRIRYLILLLGCTTLFACAKPIVNSFTVSPKNFCILPQTITARWSATGDSVSLDATPQPASLPLTVEDTGSRDIRINSEPTTFTVTAKKGRDTAQRVETVRRLTGNRHYTLWGPATCSEGRLVARVEVLEDEYSRDVVVKRISNSGITEVSVQGPRGSTVIPALSSSDLVGGSPLVGAWTIVATVDPPCEISRGGTVEGGGAEGGPRFAGVDVEVGCP